MPNFATLGFCGGQSKFLAKYPIHLRINDMQIAEDLQLIVGHMCMQWLSKQTLSEDAQRNEGNRYWWSRFYR